MKDDFIFDFLRPLLPNWVGKAALALLVVLVLAATVLTAVHGVRR